MSTLELEIRVKKLENDVDLLKSRVEEIDWWKKIAGSFASDKAHETAMNLGREYRSWPKSTPAYYESKLQGIASCYLTYGGPNEKNRLFLCKFESDMICATYYPKGRTYYFKDCEL